MIEINLLPWRVIKAKKEVKQVKLFLLLTVLLMVLLGGGLHWKIVGELRHAEQQVEQLKQAFQPYAAVQARYRAMRQQSEMAMQLANDLAAYRHETTLLLAALSKEFLYHVCFTGVTRSSNHLTFSGYTPSAVDLTYFLMHWEAARLFSDIKITHLKENVANQAMQFEFETTENNLPNKSRERETSEEEDET